MRRKYAILAAVLSTVMIAVSLSVFLGHHTVSSVVHPRLSQVQIAPDNVQSQVPTERVLVIGSSVAAGWGDTPGKGGYLARAFRSLSDTTKTPYQVISWAIAGMTTTQAAQHFSHWLDYVHPKVVVLSWGGLDDEVQHTPISVFTQEVEQEINLSLQARAVVLIVTPPVTDAAYKNGYQALPYEYFASEMAAAKALDNKNVYVFDVYDQMMTVLNDNHQTYVPYSADGWHPNAKGHKLAGELLYHDMLNQFKEQPITFQP